MDKDSLRTHFRAGRDALDPAVIARLSARACARLVDRVEQGWQRVAIYAAIGSEVRTEGLFESLRGRGIEVLLPRCDRQRRRLDFAPAAGFDDTQPGAYGIPEPTASAVHLDGIDAFVLPGLAFDRRGNRLGYGAGYYDRTLVQARGTRIGLAYASQVVEHLPADDHDLRVECVVTEAEALETTSREPLE